MVVEKTIVSRAVFASVFWGLVIGCHEPEDPSADSRLRHAPLLEEQRPPNLPVDYQEGVHYRRLDIIADAAVSDGPMEVIEFFWYGCRHCFDFETRLTTWTHEDIQEHVRLVRIPATWHPTIHAQARAFFVAETLGLLPDMHATIFDAIHRHGQTLSSEDELAALFVKNGVARDEFHSTFNSTIVDARMEQAAALARRYSVTRIPTVVVNRRYLSSSVMAGGVNHLIAIVDELVARERTASVERPLTR